jgi:hypothetical protein
VQKREMGNFIKYLCCREWALLSKTSPEKYGNN